MSACRLPRRSLLFRQVAAPPHHRALVSLERVYQASQRLAEFPVHDLAYDAVDRSVVLHHVTQAQGVVVNAQVVGTRDRTRRLPANSMGGSALGAPATRGPG